MVEGRASLLTHEEREFLMAHTSYELEASNPCDTELAQRLGVSRNTILNRRRRIRSKGVPLYPFRRRGYQEPVNPRQGNLFN